MAIYKFWMKKRKNYKKLSRFDRSLIMGLIINLLKNNDNISRLKIRNHVENEKKYIDLVSNLGLKGSENFKKQFESLIDNNLGKLIKSRIVEINKEGNYRLTSHGHNLQVEYKDDWYLMPITNK